MQYFSANEPLEFVARDIAGPSSKTVQRDQCNPVITVCYSKLTWSIPTTRSTATHSVGPFVGYRHIHYGIPTYLFTDNVNQVVNKYFETVCALLEVQHLMTTACHLQTDSQVWRFNKRILTFVRHYVAELRKDWDAYIQALLYGYNTQALRLTNRTPFSLAIRGHSPGSTLPTTDSAHPTDSYAKTFLQILQSRPEFQIRTQPPLITTSDMEAKRTAVSAYINERPRSLRPFLVIVRHRCLKSIKSI